MSKQILAQMSATYIRNRPVRDRTARTTLVHVGVVLAVNSEWCGRGAERADAQEFTITFFRRTSVGALTFSHTVQVQRNKYSSEARAPNIPFFRNVQPQNSSFLHFS